MDSEGRTEFFQDNLTEFPRRLPENCVEYILFLIDDRLDTRRLLSELESIRKAALQLCDRIASVYVWQRDPFQLQVKNHGGLIYLYGSSDYGDSVEDEWLIVYLLRELTKSFLNLWARVYDSDGEFLLIEAASVVPGWLSPEIDGNRAWIHQGQLKILSLAATSGEKRPLSLSEAVNAIRYMPDAVSHSMFVEAEAFYRLEKYPQQITSSLHYSIVTIPRKLAPILQKRSAAIAPAVEAFYLRDPMVMKPLHSLSFKAHFPPEDLVDLSVKFTKVLFAQLKSQHFSPPPLWNKIIEAAEAEAHSVQDAPTRLDRLHMGMKVTSGFEMLASTASIKDNRISREFSLLLADLEEDIEQGGNIVLPTDEALKSWPNAERDDDESWLDINFRDFENELQGKQGHGRVEKGGFGSASTQADLQKIVSRFEAFMNDDTAGLDGAKVDDMDEDDEVSDDEELDSEDEDKDVSFDEDQFATMMREMMGLPPDASINRDKGPEQSRSTSMGRFSKPTHDEENEDDEAIGELAAQMEAELNEHGALRLDRTPKKSRAVKGKQHTGSHDTDLETRAAEGDQSDSDEIDVDYNLAKNLLESFKSQAGLAGPAGNILGMMGMKLPRDEDEEGHQKLE